ncbi:MAG: NUDIX domain-containing protein [Patescibacteria group bacterium]
MNQLAIVNLNNISEAEAKDFYFRQAVRAIILDSENKIALMSVAKHHYHKLPGGGIEKDEIEMQALARECREEAGCQIEVIGEVGSILEYKDQWQLKQESFCYLAKVVGQKGNPEFTEEELFDDFKLIWIGIDQAIELIKSDQPEIYEGRIINTRDLTFLLKAREIIEKTNKKIFIG